MIERRQSPALPITLSWTSYSDAAREAGLSRRLGGIHFEQADVEGQRLGRRVAASVWERAARLMRPRDLLSDLRAPATVVGLGRAQPE